MEKRLNGACTEFCPSKEVKLRRRERLVHRLESDKVERGGRMRFIFI